MQWSTACLDWKDRIVQRRSLIPFDPLFPDEAAAALTVFKSLRIVDLPGMPTFGEVSDQWVFDFVAAIFGAYDARTGRRLINEFMLLISKKNTKSTIAAGIMMTALLRNWRHSAELLILAPTIEVANNSFVPARGMVRNDPELDALLHVIDNQRIIKHRTTEAELKIVAADADTVAGKKAAFVLRDELWRFGKKANAGAMFGEATGGQVSRHEGFTIDLTTHSDEPPAGVFKTRLEYARDVRDGVIEDKRFLPVLYEFPEEMIEAEAYLDPDNFYVTNPNLGRSVDADWLKRELGKAMRGDGEEDKQVFLAKHLNVEIGLRLRRDRWRGADFWQDAAFKPLRELDHLLDRSEVVVIGIDGGGLDDLAGFCVVGRDRRTKAWLYWCHAFAHRKVLQLRKEIAPLLLGFEKDGDLTFWGDEHAAPSNVVKLLDDEGDDDAPRHGTDEDIAAMVALCTRVRDSGLLPADHAIGTDPAGIGALIDALEGAGFTLSDGNKGDIAAVSQGAVSMFSAINTLERKLEAGTAAHGGTDMMNWCVGNAKAEQRGNSVIITKQAAGRAKIDPLIAALVATKLMERNPEAARAIDVMAMIG
jgi:Phage terminase-like protein, large subunit